MCLDSRGRNVQIPWGRPQEFSADRAPLAQRQEATRPGNKCKCQQNQALNNTFAPVHPTVGSTAPFAANVFMSMRTDAVLPTSAAFSGWNGVVAAVLNCSTVQNYYCTLPNLFGRRGRAPLWFQGQTWSTCIIHVQVGLPSTEGRTTTLKLASSHRAMHIEA